MFNFSCKRDSDNVVSGFLVKNIFDGRDLMSFDFSSSGMSFGVNVSLDKDTPIFINSVLPFYNYWFNAASYGNYFNIDIKKVNESESVVKSESKRFKDQGLSASQKSIFPNKPKSKAREPLVENKSEDREMDGGQSVKASDSAGEESLKEVKKTPTRTRRKAQPKRATPKKETSTSNNKIDVEAESNSKKVDSKREQKNNNVSSVDSVKETEKVNSASGDSKSSNVVSCEDKTSDVTASNPSTSNTRGSRARGVMSKPDSTVQSAKTKSVLKEDVRENVEELKVDNKTASTASTASTAKD